MTQSTNLIHKVFGLYLMFFLFFFFTRHAAEPAWFDWTLQLLMLFTGWGIVSLLVRYKFSTTTCVFIFVYHVAMAFIMRWTDAHIYGDPLGAFVADAGYYRSIGERLGNQPFSALVRFWNLNDIDMDDKGYTFIVWLGYSLFGRFGLNAILVFNGIVVAWGAGMLYRLSCRFVRHTLAKVVALLWGIMPYAIYTSSVGLKENFFAFCVIFAFYYSYIFYEQHRLRHLLFVFLGITSIFFFRLALGYAALLAFLSYFFLKSRFVRQHTKLSFCVILLAVLPIFPILSNSVMEQRGYSYESLSEGTERKVESLGGTVGQTVNVVAGFIGPIPNFVTTDQQKRTYITRYSFTPFFKMLISFFFLYAAYRLLFRRFDFTLMPFFIFIALNIIVMMFTFYTLHDRYHWPDIPLFFITCAWGLEQYLQYSRRNKFLIYLGAVSLIIMTFNFR